jgi:hypothetical protein
MKEVVREFVNGAFRDYEQSKQLDYSKEVISERLTMRIEAIIKKGSNEEEALKQAFSEFADVLKVANSIGHQKRAEFISQVYANRIIPINRYQVGGYCLSVVLIIIGLIGSIITFNNTGLFYLSIESIMIFAAISTGILIYLYLTKDRSDNYPMNNKRAIYYSIFSLLLALSILISLRSLFMGISYQDLVQNGGQIILKGINTDFLRTLIIVIIPLSVLIFLSLTEKSREKPNISQYFQSFNKNNEIYDVKFGLLSGVIWITSFGLFVLLGYLIGWYISWVMFIFALSAQLIVQYCFIDKDKNNE